MKALILGTLMMISTLAQAQTTKLECGFTEPFFDITIDLQKKEVTRTDYDWNNVDPNSDYITSTVATEIRILSNLSDPFLPQYQVLNKAGAVIADITMNMNGSDGMSDIVYPYSVHFDGNYGGCRSNLIKEILPEHN